MTSEIDKMLHTNIKIPGCRPKRLIEHGTLARLFTIKIAIVTKYPHACTGSQAHCWMEVGIAKIGSKRFDDTILARCCQSAKDAALNHIVPRRPVNQLYQLIDTASLSGPYIKTLPLLY